MSRKVTKRGNADLHARANALMEQPVVGDWHSLERVVTQLGAAAPRAAKEALASFQNSMLKLPNPFGDCSGSVEAESVKPTSAEQA
ncbi:hypothetical protein [Bradyrhizobium elkanii]|uniref:Uncharacterized protein n=1 Tax=Bradyrhizobium diazoefficiens TaxID=1355477 RepID=A0A809ZCM7_9BRAD|nr:hypothetical protein [Bradyrhizobium elkanii]BCE22245.1 hypothetical protein XF1B_49260 [Bradyrhizobium diazoefficiens]WLB04205.1 hypothetical protein QNJ80_20350 [Bradyrhizobium elkanii]BCE48510.1 hypothetical protein XF4B_48590 [Bradyrhizobium diazoefficiens]BCE92026.1 hypothetical protein XF10B_48240 [Bradyrhizobium diazoefficiens]BCF26954.1 hypothetical protein XF14B_49060 [Bradyrhizobium diazoefficiens]